MLSKDDIQHRLEMWDSVFSDLHCFFALRGFTEIPFPPLIVGAPGMEPNLDPFETQLKRVNPLRTQTAGLITSPEYSMKKLLGAGFEKIYTITPVFRNLEADTGHHGPEFLMLEWYSVGNYEDMLKETEELFDRVLGERKTWLRIPHHQANMKDGEPHPIGPDGHPPSHFFVTNYPAEEASLARINEAGFAERFEAYANGLELCNGFAELTDPEEQRRRFKKEAEERRAAGKTVFPIDEEFLEALGNIQKPVYGNALGLDRLVMLKYGIGDINQIQVFPYPNRYKYAITK